MGWTLLVRDNNFQIFKSSLAYYYLLAGASSNGLTLLVSLLKNATAGVHQSIDTSGHFFDGLVFFAKTVGDGSGQSFL